MKSKLVVPLSLAAAVGALFFLQFTLQLSLRAQRSSLVPTEAPADRDCLVGFEVVGAVLGPRRNGEHVRPRQVLDVDETPMLRAALASPPTPKIQLPKEVPRSSQVANATSAKAQTISMGNCWPPPSAVAKIA